MHWKGYLCPYTVAKVNVYYFIPLGIFAACKKNEAEEERRKEMTVICVKVWEWKRHIGGGTMQHEHGGDRSLSYNKQ